MSGIAGIFHRDGQPLDSTDIELMVQSLGRRGPDGSRVFVTGNAALGHSLLLTTPSFQNDDQPLTLPSALLTITSDARIDNREELISLLDRNSSSPEEVSDCSLIVGAYEKWGDDCCRHLIGDFAFAIWDQRRQHLFCGRDHFGAKPFYFYSSADLFVFASEVRALLTLRYIPKVINEARIADYLVSQLEGLDFTSTFYQGIERLPPAHTLRVSREDITARPYWTLDPERELNFKSDKDYADAFGEVFRASVDCRLRSDEPVAAMLSGGLDSSSIVGVARDLLKNRNQKPLRTLSAVSKSSPCVETDHINAVLKQNGVRPQKINAGDLKALADGFDKAFLASTDLFDTQMTLPHALYIVAHRRGLRVVLDGVDGDLVTSLGLNYVAYLLRSGNLRTAWQEATGLSRYYQNRISAASSLYSNTKKVLRPAIPPLLLNLRRELLGHNSLTSATASTIINHDFARRVNLVERLERLRQNGHPNLFGTERAAHAHLLGPASSFITVALERYERVASAHSIEVRHPFLDKRLVEFCLALPWHQKRYQGWPKIILRRAMKGILPDEVRWRRGWEHLGADFTHSIIALNRNLVENVLNGQVPEISSYVDMKKLKSANVRYSDKGEIEDANLLWEAATLGSWLSRT